MKIITDNNEYVKIVNLPNGKIALVIGDNIDGYSIVLTKQELENVAKMLLAEIRRKAIPFLEDEIKKGVE